jgi:hypothetical protein
MFAPSMDGNRHYQHTEDKKRGLIFIEKESDAR